LYKISRHILFILLLFVFSISQAQEKKDKINNITDSLETELKKAGEDTGKVQLLLRLSGRLISNEPEKALQYANYAYILSKNLKYQKGIALSYSNMSNYHKNKGDYDKALEYALKSMKICKETGDNKEIAQNYNNLGMLYLTMDKTDTATQYLSKGIKLYKKMILENPDDNSIKSSMASSYVNMGNTFITQGDYEKSLEYYYKSLKIYEKTKSTRGLRTSYHNIGAINFKLEKYDLGLEFMQKSLEINKEIGDNRFAFTVASNIGVIYENMSLLETDSSIAWTMLKKALDYHFQSLKIKKELEDKRGIVISYYNIGSIYELMGNKSSDQDTVAFYYKKAMDYYNTTLQKSEETNLRLFISYSCQGIGTINYSKGNYTTALQYMLRAYKIAEELNDRERLMRGAEELSKIYSALNKYKESLEYYKIYSQNKDSIYNIESSGKIAEMEAKYETEKKEKEIELLKKDKQLQKAEVTRQKSMRNYLIIFSVLILAMIIVIYNRYRLKKKTNRDLTLQNIEIKEQKEEIIQQNEEILTQRDELDAINNELLNKNKQITDSILYAETIQKAILPGDESFKRFFPDSFILFMPRDIVSGDFYWLSQNGDHLYFAVADCTGHGVPGAFMSMIGNTLLNEIVHEKYNAKPSEILKQLNEGVIYSLNQGKPGDTSTDDGMDISLFRLNRKNKELLISCANRQAIMVSNGQTETIEGDIWSIGGAFAGIADINFTDHNIPVSDDLKLYLFSDGYYDQFGGEENNKFMITRFTEIISKNHDLPMQEQSAILKNEFESWKGIKDQLDDVLVIGVKI